MGLLDYLLASHMGGAAAGPAPGMPVGEPDEAALVEEARRIAALRAKAESSPLDTAQWPAGPIGGPSSQLPPTVKSGTGPLSGMKLPRPEEFMGMPPIPGGGAGLLNSVPFAQNPAGFGSMDMEKYLSGLVPMQGDSGLTMPPTPPPQKSAFEQGAPPIPAVGDVANMLQTGGNGGQPPPSTNDPLSGEPVPVTADMPMPRPRPPEADQVAGAPLSLAAGDYQSDLPPNAAPTQGQRRPIGEPAMPEEKSIFSKIFDPNKAATYMALGSGFAGAGSIGTGMSRAFGAAGPAMIADRAQATKDSNIASTYRALVAKGVPPADALAASQNPDIMKAVASKYFETKPRVPHVIGTDRFGNQIQGSFDPNSGKFYGTDGKEISGVAAQGGGGGINTGQPQDGGGETGEAFLKTLPDRKYADKVKAIAEGREPFPQGQIMRSPYGRKLGEDVLAYDPSFDAVNYKARETTRKDFTSGKSAVNLTAFNTAIQHLDTLDRSIAGLNNSNWTDWNKIANNVSGRYDPKFQAAQKSFAAARTAVADELTRAFRGSGGNVHDIIAWEKTINEADSPAALRAAVKQATELLRGRIDAVGDQYNRGMGTTKDPLELLNPKAREAFNRLHQQDPQRGPVSERATPGVTSNGVPWSVVQ